MAFVSKKNQSYILALPITLHLYIIWKKKNSARFKEVLLDITYQLSFYFSVKGSYINIPLGFSSVGRHRSMWRCWWYWTQYHTQVQGLASPKQVTEAEVPVETKGALIRNASNLEGRWTPVLRPTPSFCSAMTVFKKKKKKKRRRISESLGQGINFCLHYFPFCAD